MTRAEAESIIASLVKLRESATDEQAAKAPRLYKTWIPGLAVKSGDRLYYPGTDRLYKVVSDHTTQADWTPDTVPALYTVIDVAHAGTKDDPIPAERGMEYTYGLYYKDPEDGKTYLCERIGEPSGGTVILQFLPHELIGLYFEEIT